MQIQYLNLTLAAVLLSGTGVSLAGPPSDLDGEDLGEDAYFQPAARYSQIVGDDQPPSDDAVATAFGASASVGEGFVQPTMAYAGGNVMTDPPAPAPMPATDTPVPVPSTPMPMAPMPSTPMPMATLSSDCGCSDGDCGGCSASMSCELSMSCNPCKPTTWATFETLLWFVENRQSPALVTTAPETELPILSNPNTITEFGGEIDGGLSVGGRFDVGAYLSDNFGIGGRFWILTDNSDDFAAAGDGTGQSIGIPFFNVAADLDDALVVNLNGNGNANTTFIGGVDVESSLEAFAAEAYGRLCFHRSKYASLDFLGGYTHLQLDDNLTLMADVVNGEAFGGNPVGTRRMFRDVFDTENEFNGGQLGFEAVITRGKWMVRSLTKVHLGNMSQTVSIDGGSRRQVPGGPLEETDGGIFARGNQGTFERDVFSFIPEANFKVGYRFRPNVLLSVGYSFLYVDNVALAGDSIDSTVSDPLNFNTATLGARPAFTADEGSLFLQGIDLGVILDF